ncbi:hypothetical protein MKW92_049720 [Papaver armeniacum]|nr:hypothetical protein MKW92_049720 [Papaver armeniacum]
MGTEGGQERLVRSKILPLTVDAHGNVAYDAILRQNENASKIVYASYTDLVPKVLKVGGDEPDQSNEIGERDHDPEHKRYALEKIVNDKLSAAQPKNAVASPSATKLINLQFGAKERIVTLTGMPVDPLEPPKSKHKKVPKASGSPPVTVMHSPPRPPTVQDYQDRKIPPCVSNWKNPKGYTIPLWINVWQQMGEVFKKFRLMIIMQTLRSVVCCEGKSRESVALRSKVHKETLLKEKEKNERELRAFGTKSSVPKGKFVVLHLLHLELPRESREEREERLKREKIREERKRERKRERRLEAKDEAMGKKSKVTGDRDRDVSEKVALGMANTGAPACGGDIMYDQRLFDQDKGMDSDFLSTIKQNTISTLYKPRKDTLCEMYGGADEHLEKVLKTDRFKPHKGFTGALKGLVQGISQIFEEVQGGGKKALEKVGSGGTLRESGGGSCRDNYDRGSGGR